MPSSCEHQYNQSCSSLHQVNWNAIQSKACKGQLHPDVCTNHALDTQFDAVYRVNQPCGIQPCSYKWIQSKCNGCNTKESLVELEIDYHPPFPMAMTSNVWECISNPTSGPTHHWWHQWRWLAKLFPPWQWAGVVASIHQQQQARGGGGTHSGIPMCIVHRLTHYNCSCSVAKHTQSTEKYQCIRIRVWKGMKDEVKRPKGPPTRGRGPEGPQTFSTAYYFSYEVGWRESLSEIYCHK